MSNQNDNESDATKDDELMQGFILRLHDWQDKQSWNEVYRRYNKLVYTAACRAGLSQEEAQDVVQETFVALAKQSLKYTFNPNRSSFKSWLLRMTEWRIVDQFRKRNLEDEELPPDNNLPDTQGENFDALWEREWQQKLVSAALDEVKRKSPQQYRLFDHHVLRGKSVAEVAQELGVNAEQVYLAKHRVGGQLRRAIEQLRDTKR